MSPDMFNSPTERGGLKSHLSPRTRRPRSPPETPWTWPRPPKELRPKPLRRIPPGRPGRAPECLPGSAVSRDPDKHQAESSRPLPNTADAGHHIPRQRCHRASRDDFEGAAPRDQASAGLCASPEEEGDPAQVSSGIRTGSRNGASRRRHGEAMLHQGSRRDNPDSKCRGTSPSANAPRVPLPRLAGDLPTEGVHRGTHAMLPLPQIRPYGQELPSATGTVWGMCPASPNDSVHRGAERGRTAANPEVPQLQREQPCVDQEVPRATQATGCTPTGNQATSRQRTSAEEHSCPTTVTERLGSSGGRGQQGIPGPPHTQTRPAQPRGEGEGSCASAAGGPACAGVPAATPDTPGAPTPHPGGRACDCGGRFAQAQQAATTACTIHGARDHTPRPELLPRLRDSLSRAMCDLNMRLT